MHRRKWYPTAILLVPLITASKEFGVGITEHHTADSSIDLSKGGNARTATLLKGQDQRWGLDFAGRVESLVLGTANDHADDDEYYRYYGRLRRPLVTVTSLDRRRPSRRPSLFLSDIDMRTAVTPSLFVAADYDFSQRWYGATRLSTTVRFFIRRKQRALSLVTISDKDGSQQTSPCGSFLPSTMDFALERSIGDPPHGGDGPLTVWTLRWPWLQKPKRDASMLELVTADKRWRYPTDLMLRWKGTLFRPTTLRRRGTISVSIPWHSRFCWECHFVPQMAMGSRQHFGPTHDETVGAHDHDWWLPKVRVDALGQMKSTHEVPLPYKGLGLKFSVSRRLNWGVLSGLLPNADSETTSFTVLKCQLQGGPFTSGPVTADGVITLESLLERPVQTARVTLRQQVLINGECRR
jgi:hypothetical protein